MRFWTVVAFPLLFAPAIVKAGDTPLYQPVPEWVMQAALDQSKTDADAPTLLILDSQQRIEGDRLWSYSDMASRVASAEMLGQFATLTLPWIPDKGDLIIHDLRIIRGEQEIDLLATGKGFTVLRREEGLEQLVLTGILTATMAVEGLRVGDILRLRMSTTMTDTALGGRVQSIVPLIPAPMRIGFGRLRMQWDSNATAQWKASGFGVDAKPVKKGGYTELLMALPIAKQPDMPGDAPARFTRAPMLELSTFANWADVSKVMAPLYRTEGLIGEGSALAIELAKVKVAATPIERAQRALQLVQDHVRYLALGMNGGNYVPQKPEESWTLRYGDCKAKTLLLLALLRESGIEAEPVLVSSQQGDLLPERLPSAAAFDHVIVRAVVDGQSLWLDGTGSGTRIEDIRDTPPFRHALPLRPEGADLIPVAMRTNARPSLDVIVDADESTSVDLPSAFTTKAVVRGGMATQLNLIASQLDAPSRNDFIRQFFTGLMGEGQYVDMKLDSDAGSATATLSARGATTKSWFWTDKQFKRHIIRSLGTIHFDPDRARTAWSAIPVATPDPNGMRYRLRLRLPQGGKGFTIEGEGNATARIAGRDISRAVTFADGIVTVEERIDATGAEIPVSEIPAERDRLATAAAQLPMVVAPADTPRRWDLDPKMIAGATQLKAVEAIFAKAIADAEPEDVSGYSNRAGLRAGMGDSVGAVDDLTKMIAVEPSVAAYVRRAGLYRRIGRLKEAIADAEKAFALDPSSDEALDSLAKLLAEKGELPRAVTLIDQRIALGGTSRDTYRRLKASVLGRYGDPKEALDLLDTLVAAKPGNPDLLNERCWVKGTRAVMLDTALKDCTRAIELSTSAYAALDSRGLVWFRLERYEEAVQDLDAVLAEAPGVAEGRFMRAMVYGRLGRTQEKAADLVIARRLNPRIDDDYARYGITP